MATKKLTQRGNTKLKTMRMFNIPATKDICSMECNGCYAIKEQRRFPAVQSARGLRYEMSKASNFADIVISELKALRKPPKYFRIHASGEFYSQSYVDKWFKIANALPNITFYAYTKRLKHFDFSEFANLSNVRLIDSLKFKKINYGPISAAPNGAFICPDHDNNTQCGVTCTYCMQVDGAAKHGVFFLKH